YAILLRNETDKWIGIYKFVNLSPHIPALFVSIGIGIGSFYLIWNFLPKWNDHVVDLEHSSSTLTSNVSNNAIKYVKLSNNNKFSFRRSIFGIIFTTITTAIDFIFLENGSKTASPRKPRTIAVEDDQSIPSDSAHFHVCALYTKIVYLSTTQPPKATLSKVEIQTLATSNDPSISFAKPANVRSEVWTNYSQVYYKTEGLDYIICLQCRVVLKWISENARQRTISSYCPQSSLSKECPVIQKRIREACAEYCAVGGHPFESVAGAEFINLTKQLINAGATLGTSVIANELITTSSHYRIHYGGLSLHYIDAQLNLRVFTLACRAYDYTTQHSINIRLFVDKILEEFNLPLNDHVFIVTDNENKMKSAFKDDVKRIGCSAHYINKVLEHASKNDSINCDAVCQ
ncbi:unnamed protein product, partial [Rotaria magnacalcarata]